MPRLSPPPLLPASLTLIGALLSRRVDVQSFGFQLLITLQLYILLSYNIMIVSVRPLFTWIEAYQNLKFICQTNDHTYIKP